VSGRPPLAPSPRRSKNKEEKNSYIILDITWCFVVLIINTDIITTESTQSTLSQNTKHSLSSILRMGSPPSPSPSHCGAVPVLEGRITSDFRELDSVGFDWLPLGSLALSDLRELLSIGLPALPGGAGPFPPPPPPPAPAPPAVGILGAVLVALRLRFLNWFGSNIGFMLLSDICGIWPLAGCINVGDGMKGGIPTGFMLVSSGDTGGDGDVLGRGNARFVIVRLFKFGDGMKFEGFSGGGPLNGGMNTFGGELLSGFSCGFICGEFEVDVPFGFGRSVGDNCVGGIGSSGFIIIGLFRLFICGRKGGIPIGGIPVAAPVRLGVLDPVLFPLLLADLEVSSGCGGGNVLNGGIGNGGI